MLTDAQILDHAKTINLIDADKRDAVRDALPISDDDRLKVQDTAIELIATHTGMWFNDFMGTLILQPEQRFEDSAHTPRTSPMRQDEERTL